MGSCERLVGLPGQVKGFFETGETSEKARTTFYVFKQQTKGSCVSLTGLTGLKKPFPVPFTVTLTLGQPILELQASPT